MIVETRSMTKARQLKQTPEENQKMVTSLNFHSRRNPSQTATRARAEAAVNHPNSDFPLYF